MILLIIIFFLLLFGLICLTSKTEYRGGKNIINVKSNDENESTTTKNVEEGIFSKPSQPLQPPPFTVKIEETILPLSTTTTSSTTTTTTTTINATSSKKHDEKKSADNKNNINNTLLSKETIAPTPLQEETEQSSAASILPVEKKLPLFNAKEIKHSLNSPIYGYKWSWVPITNLSDVTDKDIDAKMIVSVALKYLNMVKREIGKESTTREKRSTTIHTNDVYAYYDYHIDSNENDSFNDITTTTILPTTATTTPTTTTDNSSSSAESTTNWNNVVISVPATNKFKIHKPPAIKRIERNIIKDRSVAKRLDRESRLLDHLWLVYTSKCQNNFGAHTSECDYGKQYNAQEFAIHVRLALLNLLDADDPERLLQLGCILLLRVTNQFSDELTEIFESTVDDLVICERLVRIAQLCKELTRNNFENIENSVNKYRTIASSLPQLRSSTHNDGIPFEKLPISCWRIRRKSNSKIPRYLVPSDTLGIGKYLNRWCSFNGMCVDTIDPTLLTIETGKIDENIRHFIRNAWTERRTIKTTAQNIQSLAAVIVNTIILFDGTIVTYVDNYDGKIEAVVPLRRIPAVTTTGSGGHQSLPEIITEASPSSDIEKNFDNFQQFTSKAHFDFQRSNNQWLRVIIKSRSRVETQQRLGITTAHVRINCTKLGTVDTTNTWFIVRGHVPAKGRALFISSQTTSSPPLVPETISDTFNQYSAAPVIGESWLKTEIISSTQNILNILVNGRCLIAFSGWKRNIPRYRSTSFENIGLNRISALTNT